MDINYQLKVFEELSLRDLYSILKLRQEVFIVEQDCVYLDCDDKDMESYHLMGLSESGELVSYSRILPPGLSYDDAASIGRVLTGKSTRGSGKGHDLMKVSLMYCQLLFEDVAIRISAQCYLIEFYSSLGFETVGESYLEDGIPHIEMVFISGEEESDS